MNKEEIELTEVFAVIGIPENTVTLDITAKIMIDDELKSVTKSMNMTEVRHAIQEAEDGYISEDAKFVFTEKGRAYAESLKETIYD